MNCVEVLLPGEELASHLAPKDLWPLDRLLVQLPVVVKAIEMGLMRVFPAGMIVSEIKGNDRNWFEAQLISIFEMRGYLIFRLTRRMP